MELRSLFHVELYYRILRAVDLGRDAASIYRGAPATAVGAWATRIARDYSAATGRLYAQILPLRVEDESQLMAQLRADPTGLLKDPAGRSLRRHLLRALHDERERLDQRWRQQRQTRAERAHEIGPYLAGHLEPLRARLWSRLQPAPPPLVVFDCRALGDSRDSHGRATTLRGERRVAVSLAPPREQVLCQILHEEVHPLTDPAAPRGATSSAHTRPDRAGFETHHTRETLAVEVTQALLETHGDEELLTAFCLWRSRYRV